MQDAARPIGSNLGSSVLPKDTLTYCGGAKYEPKSIIKDKTLQKMLFHIAAP